MTWQAVSCQSTAYLHRAGIDVARPGSHTGRHYLPRLAAATQGERELLDRQMDLFRQLVIAPIDTQISSMAQKRHGGAGSPPETVISVSPEG